MCSTRLPPAPRDSALLGLTGRPLTAGLGGGGCSPPPGIGWDLPVLLGSGPSLSKVASKLLPHKWRTGLRATPREAAGQPPRWPHTGGPRLATCSWGVCGCPSGPEAAWGGRGCALLKCRGPGTCAPRPYRSLRAPLRWRGPWAVRPRLWPPRSRPQGLGRSPLGKSWKGTAGRIFSVRQRNSQVLKALVAPLPPKRLILT